jgi:hypothetical protein
MVTSSQKAYSRLLNDSIPRLEVPEPIKCQGGGVRPTQLSMLIEHHVFVYFEIYTSV